ncbi:MAG TPA: hypothetical protein VJA94_24890, partial [Candidatus Angelobacter sp.]
MLVLRIAVIARERNVTHTPPHAKPARGGDPVIARDRKTMLRFGIKLHSKSQSERARPGPRSSLNETPAA